MAKRIVPDCCCGLIVDVQEFFLSQLDRDLRTRIVADIKYLIRLLGHFHIPVVVTLERPIEQKGVLPPELEAELVGTAATFGKDFFDLTKEKAIKRHLARLKRRQMIVAGCETDVCVLQSCLGLLDLGYEVFVMEELLFSASRNVASALDRLKSEGATFLTYKTLYYELLGSVGGRNLPSDLPDISSRDKLC